MRTLAAELEVQQVTQASALTAVELEIRTWRGELVLAAPLAARPAPAARNVASLHAWALAGFLAARGDPDAARRTLLTAADDPAVATYAGLLLSRLAELELEQGRADDAAKTLARLADLTESHISPWARTTLHRSAGTACAGGPGGGCTIWGRRYPGCARAPAGCSPSRRRRLPAWSSKACATGRSPRRCITARAALRCTCRGSTRSCGSPHALSWPERWTPWTPTLSCCGFRTARGGSSGLASSVPKEEPGMAEERIAYRTCPLCEATCGLELTMMGDRIVRVRGDEADVFSRGFICPKGASFGHLDADPDRLRAPRVRRDGRLAPASWDEAFATAHAGLTRIISEYGRDAVALYLGNPNVHTLAGNLHVPTLRRALGSRNVFTASTLDQMPKHVACGYLFGSIFAIPVPDIDRTDFLLILGADPYSSNGSLWTVPDAPGRLKALQARGGRFVVVDPRRSRTAKAADRHVPIRPGTDVFLLLGMVHELFAAGLSRWGAWSPMWTVWRRCA